MYNIYTKHVLYSSSVFDALYCLCVCARARAASKSATGGAPVAERMSATRIAAQLVRERGLLGLYKGYTPTFLRDVAFSMLYFPLFAHVNELVRSLFLSTLLFLSFGSVAGSDQSSCELVRSVAARYECYLMGMA